MAHLWTGAGSPPVELIERRICQEYNYSPLALRQESAISIMRYLAVLGAENEVARQRARK